MNQLSETFASETGVIVALREPHWYAACTSANHEKRVAASLAARGVQHFLPLYRSVSRWKDRRAIVDRPLFPGYLFVCLCADALLTALKVPGVARIVGFGGRPYEMPRHDIESLQMGINGGLDIRPHAGLKSGTRVRICEGPLIGIEGVLIRHKNSHRVVLTVLAIEQSAVVEVEARAIECM